MKRLETSINLWPNFITNHKSIFSVLYYRLMGIIEKLESNFYE